jgi:hypothetical protein
MTPQQDGNQHGNFVNKDIVKLSDRLQEVGVVGESLESPHGIHKCLRNHLKGSENLFACVKPEVDQLVYLLVGV